MAILIPHPCEEMEEVEEEEEGVLWKLGGGRWDSPAPEAFREE